MDALDGEPVGSSDGGLVGVALVGDELGGGVVSSLGSGVGVGVGLASGVGVAEGSGDVSGVGLGVGVVPGLVVSLGLGSSLGLGDAVSFSGALVEGAGLVGSGIGTSMSCPFSLSLRGSPVFRMGSAAMVVLRESTIGLGWPGISGRKLRGSFQRPLMMTSKCTWHPVEFPVVPLRATSWPCLTTSPTLAMSAELWL